MTNDIAWGPRVEGLRLGIRTDAARYQRGETPIMLRILLENGGAVPVRVAVTHPLRDYVFEATDANGSIAMTEAGRRIVQADWSDAARSVVTVPAGSTREIDTVDVDTWFQVDRPGTYSVRARREALVDTGIRLSSETWTFSRI